MPLVVNLQRKIKIVSKEFKDFSEEVCASIDERDNLNFAVAFVSDERMKELNGFFRGKDSTTDVLSFPHEPDKFENTSDAFIGDYLGDVVISIEQAERQANENGLTLQNEIKQLILHGVLHLCGYDHETDDGEMNTRELELRRKLGI